MYIIYLKINTIKNREYEKLTIIIINNNLFN